MTVAWQGEIADAAPAWKLVCERMVTLGELERLSVEDVDGAVEALEAWQAAEHAE